MTELRKQFEVLHHIESMMRLCGAEYHVTTKIYKIESTGLNDREVCSFINGAWYAFQEQQKKIDKIVSVVENQEQVTSMLDTDYNHGGNTACRLILQEIKELLK